MRRLALPAPRHLSAVPDHDPQPIPVQRMPGPGTAAAVPRRHFDPREGWFRRIERAGSRFLSRRVFPHLPGTSLPYTWILDHRLECSEAQIALPGLGPGLDGVAVLLVTDLHAGPFLSSRALGRALDRAMATHPDVVLLGGDFATTHLGELEPHLPVLAGLRAPLGVWAVLGNHDHYTEDAGRLRAMLADADVRVLHNDASRLERNGARLVLAGIDDLHWGRPDLPGTVERARSLDPDAPMVLLSHNPDVFFSAAALGISLVLSGHTHGGQVRVPGMPVLARMSRYRLDEGRYRFRESDLVVSRGIGASGLPVRIQCPPEIVRLVLRSGMVGTPRTGAVGA